MGPCPWTVDFLKKQTLLHFVFGYNEPNKILFRQDTMRNHLIPCLEAGQFSKFPFDVNTTELSLTADLQF